jgi:hypothetical protein
MRFTISIFPSLSTIDDIANVIMVHATNERYVLITALCCSPPVAAAPLKLGQYNQRNTVPIEFVKKEIIIKERQSTFKIKTLKHVSVTLHQPYISDVVS